MTEGALWSRRTSDFTAAMTRQPGAEDSTVSSCYRGNKKLKDFCLSESIPAV